MLTFAVAHVLVLDRLTVWLPMVTHVTVNLLFSLLLVLSYLVAVS
jgi:hypothetical protein